MFAPNNVTEPNRSARPLTVKGVEPMPPVSGRVIPETFSIVPASINGTPFKPVVYCNFAISASHQFGSISFDSRCTCIVIHASTWTNTSICILRKSKVLLVERSLSTIFVHIFIKSLNSTDGNTTSRLRRVFTCWLGCGGQTPSHIPALVKLRTESAVWYTVFSCWNASAKGGCH